jgi:hypothetical protein
VKNEFSFEKNVGGFFFNKKSKFDTLGSNSSGEYHEGI